MIPTPWLAAGEPQRTLNLITVYPSVEETQGAGAAVAPGGAAHQPKNSYLIKNMLNRESPDLLWCVRDFKIRICVNRENREKTLDMDSIWGYDVSRCEPQI
jgi:hypothetical protein